MNTTNDPTSNESTRAGITIGTTDLPSQKARFELPITFPDGPLRIYPTGRRPVRVRMMQEDNGVTVPYHGVGEIVSIEGGQEALEAVIDTDADGWCAVELDPNIPVRFDAGRFPHIEPTSGWVPADEFGSVDERAERTILRRSWNLCVRVDEALIGMIIHVRGAVTEAVTVDKEACAYSSVPPGPYRITRRDLSFTPATVDVGSSPREAAVTARPNPPRSDPRSGRLVVRIAVPVGFAVEGELLIEGPTGEVATIPAGERVDVDTTERGVHRVALRGHPLLEGEVTVDVTTEGVTSAVLDATPGPRSTWRLRIDGAESIGEVILVGTNKSARVPFEDGALPVPTDAGTARLVINSSSGMIATPSTPTDRDAEYATAFDGEVMVTTPTLLAYPDGWLHEVRPGRRDVRLGEVVSFTRIGGEYVRADITLTHGSTVEASTGARPASAEELEAVSSPVGSQ